MVNVNPSPQATLIMGYAKRVATNMGYHLCIQVESAHIEVVFCLVWSIRPS